jgi:hypothetical protein
VLSATCPLALDFVVVLDVRAKVALERTKAKTQTKRSRSRNVIAITTTWYPEKFLPGEFPHGQKKSSARRSRRRKSEPVAMVREISHREQS